MNLVIIDYNLGNLFSVQHACEHCGVTPVITSDTEQILGADALILPGVGAFNEGMENLRSLGIEEALLESVKQGKPLMGICLGMQMMFEESEEFGSSKGLGLIEGCIRKFPEQFEDHKMRVPQIAWNSIRPTQAGQSWEESPLKGLANDTDMYFVHSFYADPKKQEDWLTATSYEGFEYCSSIKKNNIFATQFHPEKSAAEGLKIYKNWFQSIK